MGFAAGSSTYFIFVAAVFFVYWAAPRTRLLRLGIILLALVLAINATAQFIRNSARSAAAI